MENRTKEGFENWKLLHIFLYGNDIKSWINEENFNDPYLVDWQIMEVVEKVWEIQDGEQGDAIRAHAFNVEINFLTCYVSRYSHEDDEPFIQIEDGETTQDAVYRAMIEFVKFYNSNEYRLFLVDYQGVMNWEEIMSEESGFSVNHKEEIAEMPLYEVVEFINPGHTFEVKRIR